MKSFTITITGDCPDSVPGALILRAASEAALPLLSETPTWGVAGYEWLVSNLETTVVYLDPAIVVKRPGDTLTDLADATARLYPKQKIHAIKEFREKTGASLVDAKCHIDRAYARQSPEPTT